MELRAQAREVSDRLLSFECVHSVAGEATASTTDLTEPTLGLVRLNRFDWQFLVVHPDVAAGPAATIRDHRRAEGRVHLLRFALRAGMTGRRERWHGR